MLPSVMGDFSCTEKADMHLCTAVKKLMAELHYKCMRNVFLIDNLMAHNYEHRKWLTVNFLKNVLFTTPSTKQSVERCAQSMPKGSILNLVDNMSD